MPISSGTKKPRARYSAATIAMMARTLDPRLVPAAWRHAAPGSPAGVAAPGAIAALAAAVIDSDRISPALYPAQDDHDRHGQQGPQSNQDDAGGVEHAGLTLRCGKAQQGAGEDSEADRRPWIGAHEVVRGCGALPCRVERRLRRVHQRGLGALQAGPIEFLHCLVHVALRGL